MSSVGFRVLFFKRGEICKYTKKYKNMSEFKYKEQHAVIIKVDSEKEQKELFEKLQKMGFKNLKVVSV